MKWLIPPILFGISALVMAAVDRWWAVVRWVPEPWHWLGLAPLVLGLAVSGAGRLQFKKESANIWTFGQPNRLVTGGVFRLTRNPMYLGFILVLLGWAVFLGSLTPMAVWLVFVAACAFWYVPFEEARMAETFGDSFAAYRRTTRRWL